MRFIQLWFDVNGTLCQRGFYVKLYLGFHDFDRRRVRRVHRKMAEVTSAALDSAGDAVSLCITMIGVMALWVGLMEIAQKSGLIAKLTRGIQPFISFFRASRKGIRRGVYCHKPDCERAGARLGVYACGA